MRIYHYISGMTSSDYQTRYRAYSLRQTKTTLSYTFISRPYRVTELSFRVGGPVKTFDVQNGQFFRKGELIASIDDRDYIIRQKRTATTPAQAESEYRRISALYERDNISAASFEKALADYEKARTDYDDATNALNDTKIYAPFDGYVQQTHIEKYSDVKPSVPVVTFIDLSKVKAEAYITESMASSFQKKEQMDITAGFKCGCLRKYKIFVFDINEDFLVCLQL